jgi:hypothetical protein
MLSFPHVREKAARGQAGSSDEQEGPPEKEKAEGEPGVEAAAPAAALRWRTPFSLGLAAAALAATEAVSGTSNGGVLVVGREVQGRGVSDAPSRPV